MNAGIKEGHYGLLLSLPCITIAQLGLEKVKHRLYILIGSHLLLYRVDFDRSTLQCLL